MDEFDDAVAASDAEEAAFDDVLLAGDKFLANKLGPLGVLGFPTGSDLLVAMAYPVVIGMDVVAGTVSNNEVVVIFDAVPGFAVTLFG